MSVNERNAQALHDALVVERRRVDELAKQLAGANGAIAALREEMATLTRLVHVQRAGHGPSVRGGG